MARIFVALFLLTATTLTADGLIDLESPFEKILLIKNDQGEIQRKIVKEIKGVGGNYEGPSKDGALFVVARSNVIAILPLCPEQDAEFQSQSLKKAIHLLEGLPEDLKKSAEITPKVMVLWDSLLKSAKIREGKLTLEERKKQAEQEVQSRFQQNQSEEKWLAEVGNFMKPRSEDEINSLRERGEDLLALKTGNASEVEDYLAALSQVVPREKGGPLPELEKLSDIQPRVLPDDALVWFAGGVYLLSFLLLLFGLSFLSNFLTFLQYKFWLKALLCGLLAPLFFVGLFYLWFPLETPGKKIVPGESESFRELDIYLKNRVKPVYYLPKKALSFPREELVEGILSKLTPSDESVGYLKGHMLNGELILNGSKWTWHQGISVLGLPLGIPLRFEGGIPEPASWERPKIDRVILGRLELPEPLKAMLSDSMVNTFQGALRSTGLQGTTFSPSAGGLLSIAIMSSGVRPETPVANEDKKTAKKKEIKKTVKKEIAAEDLVKEIQDYQGRFVLLDGYVESVDSGGEYSGDSKVYQGQGDKVLADRPNGQIGLDRFDKFYLKGGITCLIKSKGVFTTDARGDIYWGPRANYIQGEPIIKKGMRVRFLTEGRVEGREVYGIRLDEAGQIACYDPQQVVDFPPLRTVAVGDADFELKAEATSKLPVSFESSDPSVAEVYKGNSVKIKKAGSTVITATQAGNSSWMSGSSSQTLVVEPAK